MVGATGIVFNCANRNVYNASSLRSLVKHLPAHPLREEEYASQAHSDYAAPIDECRFEEGLCKIHSGVVHKPVDAPELPDACRNQAIKDRMALA